MRPPIAIRVLLRLVYLLFVTGCSSASTMAPALLATPTAAPTFAPALRVSPPSPSAAASAAPSPSPSPAARGLVYVAIGASDTVGVGATNPSTEGWVPQLARLLGPQTRTVNLGISGTVLSAALKDQLPPALKEQPNLVTVWLAVNDLNAGVSLDSYSADLNTLLGALAQTRARLLVANVPDLTLVPAYADQDKSALRTEVARWNSAISSIVQRHNAQVVNLFAEYAELARNPAYISDDGFHPSSQGYRRIAELFFAATR